MKKTQHMSTVMYGGGFVMMWIILNPEAPARVNQSLDSTGKLAKGSLVGLDPKHKDKSAKK